jgi:uncharacterized phage-associated protein
MNQLRDVIAHLLHHVGPRGVNRTVLTKLVYFAELESWRRYGQPLSGVSFYRFKHGAWAPDVVAVAERLEEVEHRSWLNFYFEHNYRLKEDVQLAPLPSEVDAILQHVASKYGTMTATGVGQLSKETEPMRLTQEQGESLDLSVVAIPSPALVVANSALAAAAASFDSSRWGTQEELDNRDAEVVSTWGALRRRASASRQR